MAEPGTADLVVYQGDTFARRVAFQFADGSPLDLTGQTATAQIRRTAAAAEVLLDLTCEITDALGGEVTIRATAEETGGLAPGDSAGVWDLQLTGEEGVRTYLRGKVQVGAQVTREAVP